jgi:hypothetical protein
MFWLCFPLFFVQNHISKGARVDIITINEKRGIAKSMP